MKIIISYKLKSAVALFVATTSLYGCGDKFFAPVSSDYLPINQPQETSFGSQSLSCFPCNFSLHSGNAERVKPKLIISPLPVYSNQQSPVSGNSGVGFELSRPTTPDSGSRQEMAPPRVRTPDVVARIGEMIALLKKELETCGLSEDKRDELRQMIIARLVPSCMAGSDSNQATVKKINSFSNLQALRRSSQEGSLPSSPKVR